MIYRGPGFLADVWFFFPHPVALFCQQVVSLSQFSCVSLVKLTIRRGEGVEKDINRTVSRKPGPLLIIQYSLRLTTMLFSSLSSRSPLRSTLTCVRCSSKHSNTGIEQILRHFCGLFLKVEIFDEVKTVLFAPDPCLRRVKFLEWMILETTTPWQVSSLRMAPGSKKGIWRYA